MESIYAHACDADPLPATGYGTGPAASQLERRLQAAQAGGGQQLYRDECLRCHGATLGGGESAPELSGAAFLARWAGKTPADLLDRTRQTMPTDNPGGLGGSKYEDVVAYMLCANGYTAGTRELGAPSGPAAARSVEWRYYGGDAGSTKYSPLDQINAANVKDLKIAGDGRRRTSASVPTSTGK